MRGRYAIGLLGALSLAALNAISLLGSGYASVAERGLDGPGSPKARAAAHLAATLVPWSSESAALEGWMLAETGVPGGAARAYAKALELAPVDPLLWSEYSLALARLGQFDETLELAIGRAQALAPTSPAVQESTAELGLSYWSRGNDDLRRQWLFSMRYALDHNRRLFLQRARARGQVATFCADAAQVLGEAAWCHAVLAASGSCPKPEGCPPGP